MKFRGLALATVLALALTGCATAGPTPPVTGSPTATSPQTQTDTWLISAQGIGPYKLGQPYTPQQLPTSFQCSFTNVNVGDDVHGDVYLFDTQHQSWTTTEAPDLTATLIMSTDSFSPVSTGPLQWPKTAEGVGVGSTRSQVLAAYPDAETLSPTGFLQVTLDGVPITFRFPTLGDTADSSQVTGVAVGSGGARTEFCA